MECADILYTLAIQGMSDGRHMCSQLLDTFWPISSIVLLNIDCTSGMQPPHPVPAFVQRLISLTDLQVPPFTLPARSPLDTLWQEQI
jgi:hypothetical protein